MSSLPVTDAVFDPGSIRHLFPCLHQQIRGKSLVYLDNAATAQVPLPVIEAMDHFHRHDRANVHRGVHELSQRATIAYDAARESVARLLGGVPARQCVFTTGTTGAINLVAWTWGIANLKPGDQVLITELEHHSNIVPWQLVCARTGAELVVAPIDDRGEVRIDELAARVGPRTRLVAFAHVSNALGTVNPAADIVAIARQHGARVLIDGAQAAPHLPLDLVELDPDFYALSGHKAFGPTGIGVLYGRAELLESMPPLFGGGDMIEEVRFSGSTWAEIPAKFEAGTPHIAGAIGLGAAAEWLMSLDRDAVAAYEDDLLAYGTARLEEIDGLRLVGTARHKVSVMSFVVDGVHPQDIGTLLDQHGVAVRTGHHCTQPLMERLGVPATVRASLAPYNTRDEIDTLVAALRNSLDLLR